MAESRTLCVDPGETVGWAVFDGPELDFSGQTPMWAFADAVWGVVAGTVDEANPLAGYGHFTIERMVVEDFRIYPWAADALHWDPVRTARLIGALTFIARVDSIPFVLQPAKIKETAEAAGAEALFSRPIHPNRHANDAIRHGVYYFSRPPEKGNA